MKKVCVVYEEFDSNFAAIEHNTQTLEKIFGDYIQIENYSLIELEGNERQLEGDAFLISNEYMLPSLRNHISDFRKIILIERSILKEGISALIDIPFGSDMLVVNDSLQSTLSTTYELYNLGFSQLNLIPFDPSKENTGIYQNIQYAITPNELNFVPSYIPNVVNIKYRVISFSTMVKLSDLLKLDVNRLHFNLMHHLNSIAQPNLGFHNSYLNNYLKNEMLDLVIADAENAIIVVDYEYHPVYFNEKANLLLNTRKYNSGTLSTCIDEEIRNLLQSGEENSIISFHNEQYIMQKTPLILINQPIGYCLTLQSESNLRQIESELAKHLRKKGLYAQHTFEDIIHVSMAMSSSISIAKQAASTDFTILICGESGTGKELIAQSIHNYSSRKNAPFVAINCAALSESLLESELFGYEEGSFTGANKKGKAGLFEQAHLGTLFLDEIGDISPNLQSQLLRVLQEKQVMRIGSDTIKNVDVRIITATNSNLEEKVREGSFRQDLFFRLNVIPVNICPLRERKEDILPLLQIFLGKKYDELTGEMKQKLMQYSWPGNVRELENVTTYYKTLGHCPSYIEHNPVCQTQHKAFSNTTSHRDIRSIQRIILQLIADSSAPFHGVGRAILLKNLQQRGINLSDGKLRQVLYEMETENMITVSRGRIGCQITEKGLATISKNINTKPRNGI